MLKTFHYCNNCGKNGHAFHHCKYPITSIGVIVFRNIQLKSVQTQEQLVQTQEQLVQAQEQLVQAQEQHVQTQEQLVQAQHVQTQEQLVQTQEQHVQTQYLMIRRKDSLGFVDFIRGKYQLYNELYVKNIINGMTNAEKQRLLTDDFTLLWYSLWGENVGVQYRNEEVISREKYNKLKEGITIGNESYSLQSLITNSPTSWEKTEWGFPKGRRNYQEKELVCALREFQEETGYKKSVVKIIQNVMPFEEIFTGSNFKSYKHCYYLGNMDASEEPSEPFQFSEVSEMNWFSYSDAIQVMRPYNIEKADILKRIHKIVSEYKMI
jgi:8-oxo-dGTP pyrophosphatase MutT (NUDIX family)